MTVATAVNINLVEYLEVFGDRIDRDKRVIRDVKVVGLESGNSVRVVGIDSDETYGYSIEALEAAIPLYEGAAVNLDHPEFELDRAGERHAVSATRTAQRFGRLVNVRLKNDGLIADLEYLASHPLAEMVLEIAERMPQTLALSHNARGSVVRKDGRYVVEEIIEVKSVDLIAEKPGTTKSLFEQEATVPDLTQLEKPPEEMIETDDYRSTDAEVVEEGELAAPDPAQMVTGGFRAAIMAILDDESMDEATMSSSIAELVKGMSAARTSLGGGDVSEQEDGETKPDDELAEQEEEKKPDDVTESLAQENATLKRENKRLLRHGKARQLLESNHVKPTSARIHAVASLHGHDKEQASLVEGFTKVTARPQWPGRADDAESYTPTDSTSLAKQLLKNRI